MAIRIKFSNIQVQLGHETNLFAELDNVPKTLKSFYVSNALFKDMYNNKCELIVTLHGLPQQQSILENGNKHQVSFTIENDKWVINETTKSFYLTPAFLITLAVFVLITLTAIVVINRKKELALKLQL